MTFQTFPSPDTDAASQTFPISPQPAQQLSPPDLHASWVGIEALEARQASWEFLAQNAIECSSANEPNFLLPALKHLASDSVRVLVVEDRNAPPQQQLVAVVPIETKRVCRLPFKTAEAWRHDQSFNGTPLLAKQHTVKIWASVCEMLASDGYSLLSLDTVSASPEVDAVFKSLEERPEIIRFQRDHFQRAAFVPEADADQYFKQHTSKSLRKTLKRLLNKLEKVGEVTWEQSNEDSDYNQLAADFLRIESSGWKGEEGTALDCSESTRAFYKELIRHSASQGKARFLSMKLDGQVIALLSDFQSGQTVFSYKTAYDDSFSKFSAGNQVELKNIEHLHQDGIQLADSCTSPGKSNTSRIWGQQLAFQNLIFSLKPGLAQTAVRSLPAIQASVKKVRNALAARKERLNAPKKTTPPKSKTNEGSSAQAECKTKSTQTKSTQTKSTQTRANKTLDQLELAIESSLETALTREVVSTVDDFEKTRDIWEKFDTGPMNSFAWNLSWWKAFQNNGNLHLLTFEQAGHIVGFAPFYTDRWFGLKRLRFIGSGKTCSDYVDLICDPIHYNLCIQSLAEYIRDQKFSVVELECPKDDHLSIALKAKLTSAYASDHRDVEPSWVLELPNQWTDFLSGRRSSLRRKINKATRRLESKELTITSTSEGLSFESAMDTLKDLHTRRLNSTGKPGVFADKQFEQFLTTAVTEMSSKGQVEIIVASQDGSPIGVQIYFDSPKGFQLYQSGYSPEAMKLEPGHLLFTEMIKRAIKRGDQQFDFLRGNEPYKEFWDAKPVAQKKLRMVAKAWFPRAIAKLVETSRKMIRGKTPNAKQGGTA